MKKTALVTGANRGIGLEIAKGLKNLGHDVIMAGRNKKLIQGEAEKIDAQYSVLDVANPKSIENVREQISQVDILVNNAGVLGTGGVLDSVSEWENSMDVMVNGPFRLMNIIVPNMIKNEYGRVVNVSSGWGAFDDGVAGPGAYGVAKATLNALTVSAARTTPDTVKINAMCPGWVRTRMGGEAASRSPEEGADTAIWLATLDDDGPTGQFFRDRKKIKW